MARIRPRQVALWSFSVALVHGAGLMLVPMLLGRALPSATGGFEAVDGGMVATAGIAFAVAVIHTRRSSRRAGARPFVFRVLGLGFLTRSWFDSEPRLGRQPRPRGGARDMDGAVMGGCRVERCPCMGPRSIRRAAPRSRSWERERQLLKLRRLGLDIACDLDLVRNDGQEGDVWLTPEVPATHLLAGV